MITEVRKTLNILPLFLRRRLVLLFGLMLIGALAEMVSLGAIVPFMALLVDTQSVVNIPIIGKWLIIKPAIEQRIWVGAGFLTAIGIATTLRISLLLSNNRFAHNAGYELSRSAFRKILAQPYDWHTQHNSSEHIANLQRVNEFVNRNIGPLLNLLSALVLGGGIFSVLLYTEPQIMTGLIIGVAIFYSLIVSLVRERLQKNGKIINKAVKERVRVLQESLGGIRDVILDNSYDIQNLRYEKEESIVRTSHKENGWINQLPRYLLEFIGMAAIATVATVLASRDEGNSLTTLGLIAFGSQKLLPLSQQIYIAWSTLKSAGPARADVLALMALPESSTKTISTPITFSECFELRQVVYSYPGHSKQVLKGIDLRIDYGQKIGFVGPSGGGKSTLIDLIMGLLSPISGQVLVDNVVIASDNLTQWRARVAHVPQSIYLLDASVSENIAFGVAPEVIDMTRVQECIEMAQLIETVSSLPNGVDTIIGERGVLLSGGQRQRIGIARALYRQADILVLDEATSALDNETEHRVIEALQKIGPNITVLMIAHRLTTLAQCDRIIHIENGKIAREGSYRELMKH